MGVWNLLFPKKCFGCGYLGVYVCPGCEGKLLPLTQQECIYCKKPSLFGLTHPPCRRRDGVDGFISLFHYNNIMKKIIKGIKYSLVREAVNDLFYILAREGGENLLFYKKIPPLFIQPIPPSKERTNIRGFNQSEIISKQLSYLLSLPLLSIVERKIDTFPQAQLTKAKKRKANMRGAFHVVNNGDPPKNILLVDDVVTTGETAREAAKALKESGVEKTYVFSVAKG